MLFPKSSLQLGKVIGQGEEQGEPLLSTFLYITLKPRRVWLGVSGICDERRIQGIGGH